MKLPQHVLGDTMEVDLEDLADVGEGALAGDAAHGGKSQLGTGHLDAAALFGGRQLVVDPGGDGADLGGRHVRHRVSGTRRQQQCHHVTGPEATIDEPDGHGIR